jgi:hypothetical protein
MAESKSVLGSFSTNRFRESATWRRLSGMLSQGGCYGLSGPRYAGKTWVMTRAVCEGWKLNGLGVYYPCTSDCNANAFLSALSGTLADAVKLRAGERRLATRALALVSRPRSRLGKWRRLAGEARRMQERIRFSASVTFASQRGISGSRMLTAAVSQSRQRTLSERPPTTAALVFDFRNFARQIADTMPGPLVIAIDELDKVEDAQSLRMLLRDIKGILDIPGVTFLVSVREEATAALRLGPVKSDRTEFSSLFSQVIEMPPLTPEDSRQLLEMYGIAAAGRLPEMLCLLSGGNQGELARMADACLAYPRPPGTGLDEKMARHLLADESEALRGDILKIPSTDTSPGSAAHVDSRAWRDRASSRPGLSAAVKYLAMKAMPCSEFVVETRFVSLGRRAMRDDMWDPQWRGPGWSQVQQQWRKFLVRLFLTVSVLEPVDDNEYNLLAHDEIVTDLRDVMITSAVDADVAKLMLVARFGDDFSSPYHPAQD